MRRQRFATFRLSVRGGQSNISIKRGPTWRETTKIKSETALPCQPTKLRGTGFVSQVLSLGPVSGSSWMRENAKKNIPRKLISFWHTKRTYLKLRTLIFRSFCYHLHALSTPDRARSSQCMRTKFSIAQRVHNFQSMSVKQTFHMWSTRDWLLRPELELCQTRPAYSARHRKGQRSRALLAKRALRVTTEIWTTARTTAVAGLIGSRRRKLNRRR